jgi:ABC-2 type transport system ATP-binding protein
MKDMILKLREEGKTVVMCSHLLADVQDVCDRVAILYQGDLKEMGRVNNLLKVSGETQIRAKNLSPEALAEIQQVIARHNGEFISADNPRTSLEELFLNIVKVSQDRPGHRSAGAAKTK